MAELKEWETFYVIVGASAGALIGLQFVVMTLLAEMPLARDDAQAGEAFGTPNVVHFGVVLLIGAIISAPWHGIGVVAVLLALTGFAGVAYVIIVARRMKRQTVYKPVLEDWLFHLLLPLLSYAMLAIAALAAFAHERGALFVVGAASLLLLFIGIHNAWDTVTYNVFVRKREREAEQQQKP